MKLQKDEWEKLDELLFKIGFGGYYDLLAVLREVAFNLSERLIKSEEAEKWKATIKEEKDLKTMVILINYLSYHAVKKDEE